MIRSTTLLAAAVILLLLVSAGTARSYTVRVDKLSIIRNGALFFEDSFDDGVPPPSAPDLIGGVPVSYAVTGTLGPESGGKLIMDVSGAETTNPGDPFNIGGEPFLVQTGRLLTNTNSADLIRGLKISHTFQETGIFDLIIPGPVGTRYGIGLSDAIGSVPGNDDIDLVVRRTGSGQVRISFRMFDFVNDQLITLASAIVDPSHAQIALILTRPSTSNNNVSAGICIRRWGRHGSGKHFFQYGNNFQR